MKQTNTARNWSLYDNTRNPFNGADLQIMPNSSNAESSDGDIDFVSNGFKFRTLEAKKNQSGGTYIYMAFAESPFVTGESAIPTTAR